MEYPKIETLFERDKDTFAVLVGKIKNPVYSIISKWQITEKIDGTNIRVELSAEGTLSFNGRTDNASINCDLLNTLSKMFNVEKLKEVLWRDGPCAATIFGEGYGAGIQRGGCYRQDKSFRIFDILFDSRWWLSWENVSDIAGKLGIKTVPYLGDWTLEEVVERTKAGIKSETAMQDSSSDMLAEGIVGRTVEPMFDKRMNRIILKLKTKDFK